MTPDALGAPACPGKTPYPHADAARAALKRILRRRKFKAHAGERMSVYRCGACRFWHLGSALAREGR